MYEYENSNCIKIEINIYNIEKVTRFQKQKKTIISIFSIYTLLISQVTIIHHFVKYSKVK